MPLSLGDRVDRYEVLELLGAGGMGEVYRARDPKLARLVALKVLRLDGGLGTDGATRLLREARAVAALSHPNVLAVFDAGEVQEPAALRGLPYIAMELVIGESLRAYVGDESVPMERRVRWLEHVARALGAAHRAGIVHRDVKPENVMIRSDGVVKVLDFGIARRSKVVLDVASSTQGHSLSRQPERGEQAPPSAGDATLTAQGALVGTPYFMAPEQLRGETLDGRADQFAWGVMAYMLLTGKLPWKEGTEPIAVLSQILSFDPPPPRTLTPAIPAAVSDAIVRALAKDREARFATMDALVAAIRAPAVPTTAISAAPAPVVAVATAASLRPRRWLGGGAFALVALVASAGAIAWRARSSQPLRLSPPSPPLTPLTPAADGASEACRSSRACTVAHGGAAWRCHSERHVCVEVASADCTPYVDPRALDADDTVWIGGMFPLSTSPATLPEMRAAELAREDFAQALGASAQRAGGLHARPIALVVCDEGGDALRAARHLADDVEVPAVLGFRSTASAVATISSVFLPKRILSLVSISQSPAVTKIPEPPREPRLVWRSTLNSDDAITPLARLVSDVLEPAARAGSPGRSAIGARPYKVAVVVSQAENHVFVPSLFGALRFNGRSALANGANFRQFVYDGGVDAGVSPVVDELLAFAPDAIVLGWGAYFPNVVVPLEARWTREPRPFYLTEAGYPADALAAFAGRDPARRRRFLGDTNVATTMPNAELVLRYNLAFPAAPVVRSEAPQPSYDGFYVLAYATYALGDGAITGPALSAAMERLLPPGPKVDVGATGIFDAFAALRSAPDAHIDLNGAIGALDFDPATGEAPIDYAIVCPGVDDHGVASALVDSGLVYDARTKRFVGALRCP